MSPPIRNAPGARPSGDGAEVILVWDLPTRLFHWLAVALVIAAYATFRMDWMVWHARAGYALLALLAFRLAWGFFGAETARFRSFVASPSRALRHLGDVLREGPDEHVGHNPAGGWMVLLLLALLLGQTLTGVYVDNDIADQGPLSDVTPAGLANAINAMHDVYLWDALLAAIAVHVLAILAYAAKGRNLAAPMITGRMRAAKSMRAPTRASLTRALLLFACSAVLAAGLAHFL
ncbi:MAG TPA: cytochrome b/b6 domain-containing protein [Roseiarcus sp.]|nr:cytochrome b/b6 domain-containing protein [Roseiarcus sp.]